MIKIFERIANEINSEKLLSEIREVLPIYGIDEASRFRIVQSVEQNLAWIGDNTEELRIFLYEFLKEHNSSSTLRFPLVSCLMLLFTRLLFNWILQN